MPKQRWCWQIMSLIRAHDVHMRLKVKQKQYLVIVKANWSLVPQEVSSTRAQAPQPQRHRCPITRPRARDVVAKVAEGRDRPADRHANKTKGSIVNRQGKFPSIVKNIFYNGWQFSSIVNFNYKALL